MESLYILIPLSVLAVVVAVLVFFWMNKSGQFDDDQGPAWSILLDDDRPVQARSSVDKKVEETLSEAGDKADTPQNDIPPKNH